MDNETYITIKELAELKGVSTRSIRLSNSKYISRAITVKGGKSFEILLSSIEPELQEKYYSKIVLTYEVKQLPTPLDFHKPDKAKIIALARLDLLTCVFEVKRAGNIPKRQIQILTPAQLVQLFRILKKKYTYMLPIVQKLITLKQPLNTILTGSEKADGQNEVSPVSEQIEPTARMCKRRNSVSTKLFQDSE